MRTFVNCLRLVAVIAVAAAVLGQWLESARTPDYLSWNFFGYFTIQSNIAVGVALALTLVAAARRKRTDVLVSGFRGAATVYIATTGVVYNTLLVGVGVANSVPWSNDLLHRWVPLYAVLDWLLFSDRARLLLRHVWWFLLYPAVWLVVVLVRGATDGWVPYPFLAPAQGYGVVALYCCGVAVFIALTGILVVGMSRLRLVRV
ncbi:Pr6Pr family membrane protein [Curtobacterium caseinilyticum]|uniref:Pr6Pr family membrane protein n=1 Tax=Curtobacterium caseinilyticum TaxID=3055137 RepID=A0ABT7TMZ7_9MICO|nr:Pr6Pr family membrane protein [Curtobacterium caseinilyticum]MDM7890961.1 Pr6Pr family membrane protein [Curtobacterium caseinilyticum]